MTRTKKPTTEDIKENAIFENSAILYLILYGIWKNKETYPRAYFEVLDYTSFNNFIIVQNSSVWTKQAWATAVHKLNELELVIIPGLSHVDGLSSVGLSSFGCSVPVENKDEEVLFQVLSWFQKITKKRKKIIIQNNWIELLKKIYSGVTNPKDGTTWKK